MVIKCIPKGWIEIEEVSEQIYQTMLCLRESWHNWSLEDESVWWEGGGIQDKDKEFGDDVETKSDEDSPQLLD